MSATLVWCLQCAMKDTAGLRPLHIGITLITNDLQKYVCSQMYTSVHLYNYHSLCVTTLLATALFFGTRKECVSWEMFK